MHQAADAVALALHVRAGSAIGTPRAPRPPRRSAGVRDPRATKTSLDHSSTWSPYRSEGIVRMPGRRVIGRIGGPNGEVAHASL